MGVGFVKTLAGGPLRPQIGRMKPGDHPEFFRSPPPEGASRESTIRLDPEGHFFHEGERVEHPKLAAAMHTWIRRHPDDGRFILSNGYDWTYFTVEDAPFFVLRIEPAEDTLWLELSDETREEWDPSRSRVGDGGAVYTQVKAGAEGGPYEARLTRHAQAALAPFLVESNGKPAVVLGGRTLLIGA